MAVIEQPTLTLDPEEARRVRAARLESIGGWVLPLAIMCAAILLWDRICVWYEIPKYILPRPGVVLAALYTDAGLLFSSLLVTLKITFLGLALAVIGGVGLAVLFAQSKWVEMSLFPFAIVLQVTPIVAVFPLLVAFGFRVGEQGPRFVKSPAVVVSPEATVDVSIALA